MLGRNCSERCTRLSVLAVGDCSAEDGLGSWEAVWRWENLLPQEGRLSNLRPENAHDLAALVYTSGTTGEPKGVMADHAAMIFATETIAAYLDSKDTDVVLSPLPLSFSYGLYQVLVTFCVGGTLVLERSFAFPTEVLRHIEHHGVTGLCGVPTMFATLLQMKGLASACSTLRYITNAAAALPAKDALDLRRKLPHADLYLMYGMTEIVRALYLPPEMVEAKPESVGKAIPGIEVWIEGPSGKRLGPDEIGELMVRGPNVMLGYWGAPDLTAKRFRSGGAADTRICMTGDLFISDVDGFLYFVGRTDDIIKSRGEKIAPKEIEDVLQRLEGVKEAVVIGVADPLLGEAVKAVVVRNSTALDAKRVMEHCRRYLEDYMVPRVVEFRDSLPRTASGKVHRRELTLVCGIAGFFGTRGLPSEAESRVRRMASSIRYRGPDEFGAYIDERVALASVRLCIVDPSGGTQPMTNDDESLWIVFNGEIFNHVELRQKLEAAGRRFRSRSDTEVSASPI